MATKYDRGRAFEYKVRDHFIKNGFYVIRSAGSKGKADLVALKAGAPVYLIQCKAGAISARVRREAAELHTLAEDLGAVGILAAKPAGRLELWYASSVELACMVSCSLDAEAA